ncbi:DUF4238 domain-containing protein [Chryseobacterium sp. ERMR1:04]|uniref:DUF4238 domain-containing protein n=1 Tax=Chryseobacterium sp. ERMR1:04 TaxID=1705393 RepID=UPI0006C86FED|nr:DUF4238 domain-containing protein [Chryseobacterium sp. ERMR1:04]KPH12360.1 hypothetical protein AMQ68_15635 [Chryseobacterium sp. ERMR1:04]
MTEKKNQHYIPKFYLRNSSYNANKKQIGLYNLLNQRFIQDAKLKTQGSRNFFYGKDGVIEDKLSVLEGAFAERIKAIIDTLLLPKKNSPEHIELLGFVALTDLRNPVQIQGMNEIFSLGRERIKEIDEDANVDEMWPTLTHEESVNMSLSMLSHMVDNIIDLDFKILKNQTEIPFITSDFPVVKYNQYLEQKNWHNSKTGYGLVGLQIFIPLNDQLTLVFYDPAIYILGTSKQNIIVIKDKKTINDINKLQVVNCLGTLFFNEKASLNYILKLHQDSMKYNRANQRNSKLSYIVGANENPEIIVGGKENLIILNSSDCEIKLSFNELKIHSNGKSWKLGSAVSQFRKHAINIMDRKS